MSKKGKLGTFIAGAMVGVGLGVLFAPKSGAETRKELKEKVTIIVERKDVTYKLNIDNLDII